MVEPRDPTAWLRATSTIYAAARPCAILQSAFLLTPPGIARCDSIMSRRFPGMDPYLEDPAFWPDFHLRFVNYWCEAVADRLPEGYEARIDEQIRLVEVPEEEVKRIRPDVAVLHHAGSSVTPSASRGTTMPEPVVALLEITEEVRAARIEILHRPARTLVAVLELLSPANKTDPGRADYLTKRKGILSQEVHLVELDLLVGGKRLPLGRSWPSGDYHALVARHERRPYVEIYSWTVRQPLPAMPIPLRTPDADLVVDLGEVFTRAWTGGRYERSLAYSAPPRCPLAPEVLAWAAEVASRR